MIANIITHSDQAKPCPLRDIVEPVTFDFSARLRVQISRMHDAEPVTAEQLEKIIADALAEQGIEIVKGDQ